MRSVLAAATAGALFALGLAVAGMTDPAAVTAFLDVGGAWSPALAFVMVAAIAVHAPIVRLARARRAPVFDIRFHGPHRTDLDAPLVLGAALFGVGWGLSGYCPGPALVSVTSSFEVIVFVTAMIAGIAIVRLVRRTPR